MTVVVAAVARDGGDAGRLVERAVAGAGLWAALPADTALTVAIAAGRGVAPAVVESLVGLLYAHGYTSVAVTGRSGHAGRHTGGPSGGPAGGHVGGRAGGHADGLLGDSSDAPSAGSSEGPLGGLGVIDLGADLVSGGFAAECGLHGVSLARGWVEAGFRISVAGCATHPEQGYTLCLAALCDLLPEPPADRAEAAAELLALADFHLIDAVESSHGPAGTFVPVPLATGTVVACADGVLADVVGACLMGVDPATSPLVARALADPGLPAAYRIDGDLTPFAGWRNPPRPLLDAMGRLADEGALRRTILAAAEAPRDADRVLVRIGDVVGGALRAGERNPLALAALCWSLQALGTAEAAVRSWQVMFAKERVARRRTSLGLRLGDYAAADYEAVATLLEPVESLIDALPADEHGMRLGLLDGSTVFGCERTVAAPYADFAARVDISRAISYMNDYLGGCVVPVATDEDGRVVWQAERNLYLPQPNYLAMFGGDVIDVCKLESIRYEPGRRKISWRTVRSPNGSALFDDGSVTFAAADGGRRTTITVRVRQRFTLPLFWQVVDLDAWPELKAALVADAYRQFFAATMDNFEARYEDRDFRIGRRSEPVGRPTERLSLLLDLASVSAESARERLRAPVGELDADGFEHFSADDRPEDLLSRLRGDGGSPVSRPVADYLRGLREAITRDFGRGRQR
ncbi:hypothetical protein [Nonomuraea solani]|nr:hypothetical protein [Nonomuraea solani]